MAKTYAQKLKDPRWQKRRLEILQRDHYTCRECKAQHKTLHVHHCSYAPQLEPWEYSDNDLITLCEDCHCLVETVLDEIKLYAGRLDLLSQKYIAGFIKGGYQSGVLMFDHDELTGLAIAIGANPEKIRNLYSQDAPLFIDLDELRRGDIYG